jgi:tRNA U34 5-methylaminomethyl-2-thiouridine-forming methyltransferase MnmC
VFKETITTSDGSTTLYLKDRDETYHSRHGAIAEARHVFLKHGLHYWLQHNDQNQLHILEMGFGTGLNCLLTQLEPKREGLLIHYHALEAFPLTLEETALLNYSKVLAIVPEVFSALHQIPWEALTPISVDFAVKKQKMNFEDFDQKNHFNLIYYDAFGARVQPELWTQDRFQAMYDGLTSGGVLVTYAAKGSVRRAMQDVGFEVSRLPGPPGKREMLRGLKA